MLRGASNLMVSAPSSKAGAHFFPISNRHHLLDTSVLSIEDFTTLINRAEYFLEKNKHSNKRTQTLEGRTLVNLFFESSTRTRTSFELAGKRLGMDVISIQAEQSAIKKGETLQDTATTLRHMNIDALTIRHPESGTAALLSRYIDCPVINAGDGCHQHPTQALLDAFVIQKKYKTIKGLTIAICGDITHSRVARSNAALLSTLGANIRLVGPPTLMPRHAAEAFGAEIHTEFESGIQNVDVIMMLRIQRERMRGLHLPSLEDYHTRFGLTRERLTRLAPNALILHPGPVNRGVEISSALVDDTNLNAIGEQIEAGIAVRQAVLESLITRKESS